MQGEVARRHLEFSVVQVSCASRKWTLQPLSHHKTGDVLFDAINHVLINKP